MGKNTNFIDINGQRYDATSGKPVASAAVRRINTKHAGKAQTMSDIVRRPAHHANAHSPKNSQTLMRRAVKKPSKTRQNVKLAQPATAAASTDMVLTPAAKVQAARLQHAQKVRQSKLISHFSPESQQVKPLAAAPLAPPQPLPQLAPQPPTPMPSTRSAQTTGARPTTARPSAKHAKETMLQQALERADSHERPHTRKKTKRRSRGKLAAASVLLMLVVAGAGAFAVTQPETVKLAIISAKAGFHATNPGQQIAGYSLSRANYGEGTVALQYRNQAGTAYTVTQKRTTMSNAELGRQFDSAGPDSYKEKTVGSKHVYLYGDQSATWIDDGMWYVIKSDGKLTDQQLIQLAASL